jgi:hypothetical protein
MASFLSGFKDGDAWTYRADGAIVGKARDRSYKEVARDGVPIEILVSFSSDCGEMPPVVPPVVSPPTAPMRTPIKAASPLCSCGSCTECEYIKDCVVYSDSYALPLDLTDDFEQYFAPVEPRSVARARRTGTKKPVKVLKYGPKASKAHTVATRVFLEPVPTSEHIKSPPALCCACRRPQSESVYETWQELYAARTCERCDPHWVAALTAMQAEISATLAAIEADREELRQEQRMRDARYRD